MDNCYLPNEQSICYRDEITLGDGSTVINRGCKPISECTGGAMGGEGCFTPDAPDELHCLSCDYFANTVPNTQTTWYRCQSPGEQVCVRMRESVYIPCVQVAMVNLVMGS